MKHLMGHPTGHPSETDLALLSAGDAGRLRRYSLERHVRSCVDCQEKVDAFRELRTRVAAEELPDLNWGTLAAEMRANIRLGLEAGECVRETRGLAGSLSHRLFGGWSFGLAAAVACLLLLTGASFFMRDVRPFPRVAPPAAVTGAAAALPSLESTTTGVEVRSGQNSFKLLNHEGAVANQTVSAQGAVRSRYIDAGSVTINNVYLE
jgi:hypothetical protein